MFEANDGADHLCLVRETKGTTTLADLRPEEKRKILCGRKHFRDSLAVDYLVITTVAELPAAGV